MHYVVLCPCHCFPCPNLDHKYQSHLVSSRSCLAPFFHQHCTWLDSTSQGASPSSDVRHLVAGTPGMLVLELVKVLGTGTSPVAPSGNLLHFAMEHGLFWFGHLPMNNGDFR